jgi:hypothetical protein
MWKALAKLVGMRPTAMEEKKEEFRPARPTVAA